MKILFVLILLSYLAGDPDDNGRYDVTPLIKDVTIFCAEVGALEIPPVDTRIQAARMVTGEIRITCLGLLAKPGSEMRPLPKPPKMKRNEMNPQPNRRGQRELNI